MADFAELSVLANLATERLDKGEWFNVQLEWLDCFTLSEMEIIDSLGVKAKCYFKSENVIRFLDSAYDIKKDPVGRIVIVKDCFFRIEEDFIKYFIGQMLIWKIESMKKCLIISEVVL